MFVEICARLFAYGPRHFWNYNTYHKKCGFDSLRCPYCCVPLLAVRFPVLHSELIAGPGSLLRSSEERQFVHRVDASLVFVAVIGYIALKPSGDPGSYFFLTLPILRLFTNVRTLALLSRSC